MNKLIALVDCNNFYVSCERLFRPDLIGKPVAVLSNNDGCIVARSQEVKDLGIKMGVPLFQVQQLVNQHNIELFSSNYTLYADLSARVMSILEEFTPSLEVYSIDEAFLDLSDVQACRTDTLTYARTIKKTVQQYVGIPVCVGIGPTKTLAKLANFAAKKWHKTGGVLDLSLPSRREKLMRIAPVREVWGVGARTAQKLQAMGIYTVWDLASQPPQKMQQQFSIALARTILELNGIACQALEEVAPNKQQIVCSRSFSRRLTRLPELSAALAEFASRATEKLRQQQAVCACVTVFIRTNPFNERQPQYQRAASMMLNPPSQDTRIMIAAALALLGEIFRPGYDYQKAGVQLSDLDQCHAPAQIDLFDVAPSLQHTENQSLMQTIDRVNRRFPKGVRFAATQLDQTWQSRVERLSQCYTTDWRELARVCCQ